MMKQIMTWGGAAAMSMLAGVLLLGSMGCEENDGAFALAVDPSAVTIDMGGTNALLSVTLAVGAGSTRELSLPVQWTVDNPGLGVIATADGTTAVYSARAGALGVNVVTVRDQYGAEGVATITQE